MTKSKSLQAVLLAGVLAVMTTAGPAQAEESRASEGGMGALAALSTIGYAPFKIVYATCGLVFGGFAWAFSGGDNNVANAVITPAVRGDYVVTPSILRGEKGLEFIGKDPEYRAQIAEQGSSSYY